MEKGDLASISEAIHDQWFDLDRIVRDHERSELRVTVYSGRTTGRVITLDRPPLDHELPPLSVS